MSETRLILYTNDAILLTLARFPLYIIHWALSSQSQQGVSVIEQDEEITLSSHIIHKLKTNEPLKNRMLSIEEKLFMMPAGFTPKINSFLCLDDETRQLFWRRQTIHPNLLAESGHVELVHYMDRIWNLGYKYLEELTKYRSSIKEYIPKFKRPSVLQLEAINGEKERAQDVKVLWDIFSQIVHGGNEYAKMPICMVVERKKTPRNIWEYSAIEDIPTELEFSIADFEESMIFKERLVS